MECKLNNPFFIHINYISFCNISNSNIFSSVIIFINLVLIALYEIKSAEIFVYFFSVSQLKLHLVEFVSQFYSHRIFLYFSY